MKIGILTFHRANNYGAVLQCYALQECLKSLGHTVNVVDYRPDYLEKYRMVFSSLGRNLSFSQKLFVRLKEFLKAPLILCTNRAFNKFLENKLNIGFCIKTKSDISGNYDVIFFGSDQIWSPSICNGLDDIYYGQFPHQGTKLVSYAASIGGHNKISQESWKSICRNLKSFSRISVREEVFRSQLEKHGFDATLVSDPSFLLTKELLDDLAIKPRDNNYILLFMLEEVKGGLDFAKRLAEQTHSKVIRIQAAKAIHHERGIEYVEAVTPEVFCGYIKYAKCVVNVSFHGTAFSILYNKPFYTLHSNQEDRAVNLLKKLGLEDRLVDVSDIVKFNEVDFTQANIIRKQMRQESILFIKSCLE